MNNSIVTLAAQIIGGLAVVAALFIFISKSRKIILTTKLTADVLWTLHYLLIGGFTAAALNVIGIFREIVFYNREKKWASSKVWLYVFLGLTVLSSVLTWEGPASLLAMAGMILAVFSFWNKDPLYICLLSIPSEMSWLIYNIIHHSVPGIISSSLAMVSMAIGIYRNLKGRKKNN